MNEATKTSNEAKAILELAKARERIEELESAMQEFINMSEWFKRNRDYMKDSMGIFFTQFEGKVHLKSEEFKQLLEKEDDE